MMNRRAEHSGFTLIEVMVALMVIAIALPALLKALYQQIDATAYLRDKSVAQWVASNKLAENRLQLARSGTLFRGERTGTHTMAGREWFWRMTSQETEVEDFYRVEIRVGLVDAPEDTSLYSIVAFFAARTTEGEG